MNAEVARYIFHPVHSSYWNTIYIMVPLAILGLGLMVWMFRNAKRQTDKNRYLLLAMLLGFVGLIAAGTAWFSWLSIQKISVVKIYDQAIETGYGLSTFEDILQASIQKDKENSLINPTINKRTTRLLFIETEKQMHILSEEQYNIDEILEKLRQSVREWKEKTMG